MVLVRGVDHFASCMPLLYRLLAILIHAQRSIREGLTWARLEHPNVINLKGITTDPAKDRICLVSDRMTNGNLLQYLERHPDTNRVSLGASVSHGLAPPITHGDIKANNILISRHGIPLLSDFGLAFVLDDPATMMMTNATTSGALNPPGRRRSVCGATVRARSCGRWGWVAGGWTHQAGGRVPHGADILRDFHGKDPFHRAQRMGDLSTKSSVVSIQPER
ncbi:kinase-like protein [Dacryopinax primogenitus]|uniref:Kinase-like protein n=1 Tax=Dacryopinax primogenitus (strain DJM 731) TaxID=1858805 RepID=M5G006_DACPD|nr:kinase-like protein [Dacryopinax primogenitus]EJT97102.1 kinase-like protein [Dacryopinax primogenitus]